MKKYEIYTSFYKWLIPVGDMLLTNAVLLEPVSNIKPDRVIYYIR